MPLAASPLARRLAKDNRLDLTAIQGSGPNGRIVKRDVEKALKSPTAPTITGEKMGEKNAFPDPRLFYEKGSYDEIPLTAMKRSIAKRLAQSMQMIPHYYVSMKYDMRDLLAMRIAANQALKQKNQNIKLTLNDFLIRCAALALMDVPDVNVSFADDCLLRHHHADIGVAVALTGGGLITPIITQADKKSVVQIAEEIRQLARLAQAKKLKPQQYEGGSFSLSNLGMFGVSHFTAVINPPQAAILAIGGVDQQQQMEATLSCDHRAINGAVAAQFLKAFGGIIEAPHWLWMR